MCQRVEQHMHLYLYMKPLSKPYVTPPQSPNCWPKATLGNYKRAELMSSRIPESGFLI